MKEKITYNSSQGRLHDELELQYTRHDFATDGDWQRYILKHGRFWEAPEMARREGESIVAYRKRCSAAYGNSSWYKY